MSDRIITTMATRIRRLIAKGWGATDISKRLSCSRNAVHCQKHYIKWGRKSRSFVKALEERPIWITRDFHLEALRQFHPAGYEDTPGARPVDWGAAAAWMRRNPPPDQRAVNP